MFRNPEDVKLEILTNGPVETGFMVYEDFIGYESGVYKYTEGSLLGGHAVKIIGWGTENGVSHWIAANSWGEGWGENGFFRIQEGECKFEAQVITGTVRVWVFIINNCIYTHTYDTNIYVKFMNKSNITTFLTYDYTSERYDIKFTINKNIIRVPMK